MIHRSERSGPGWDGRPVTSETARCDCGHTLTVTARGTSLTAQAEQALTRFEREHRTHQQTGTG